MIFFDRHSPPNRGVKKTKIHPTKNAVGFYATRSMQATKNQDFIFMGK